MHRVHGRFGRCGVVFCKTYTSLRTHLPPHDTTRAPPATTGYVWINIPAATMISCFLQRRRRNSSAFWCGNGKDGGGGRHMNSQVCDPAGAQHILHQRTVGSRSRTALHARSVREGSRVAVDSTSSGCWMCGHVWACGPSTDALMQQWDTAPYRPYTLQDIALLVCYNSHLNALCVCAWQQRSYVMWIIRR